MADLRWDWNIIIKAQADLDHKDKSTDYKEQEVLDLFQDLQHLYPGWNIHLHAWNLEYFVLVLCILEFEIWSDKHNILDS